MRGQGFEIREVEPGGPLELRGHASTFDTYQVGSFKETIRPGSFKRSLGQDPDVRLLINHAGLPLARTTSGTMRLSEDDVGLLVEAQLDNEDSEVQSVARKVKRGDISEMSFAFRATMQEWSDDKRSRTISEVTLHRGDVSLVTTAANPNATASLRADGMSLEQRNLMAKRVGDRLCGPWSAPDSRLGRKAEVVRSFVEEAKLRRIKLGATRASLPPHNPSPRYTFEEIQKLGKEQLAYKKPNKVFAWPIVDREDLRNAIHAIGRAPRGEVLAVKRWIIISAERLRDQSLIPDGWWDEVNDASPHGIPG